VTRPNRHRENGNAGLLEHTEEAGIVNSVPISSLPPEPFPVPTRAKRRARQHVQQNRFVIVAAGAILTALLILVAVSLPHRSGPRKTKNRDATINDSTTETSADSDDKSLFPITDSGRPPAQEARPGFVNERDLQRTAARSGASASQTKPASGPGTLGSIQPFGDKWQAPAYEPVSTADTSEASKAEREEMEKSSLMYVRKISTGSTGHQTVSAATPALGLGLAAGTRLRARLESAVTTAVRAPVLAVIEYNYEQNGEIVVPAGAKAVGQIRQANRSGYVDLGFDSLLMPDGALVPIEAAATGLDLRPLKGKVEGKNTGKNVLIRSLSGIGQAGSLFLGQGSLNQPLSESDLMRERLASNIGETGDEEVSRRAVNQEIVVTVSAGIPIYVVLQQTARSNQLPPIPGSRSLPAASAASVDQLRQLLQLQLELNQSTATNQSAQ
jgi:type IV secretory pathway VirB10-like protein